MFMAKILKFADLNKLVIQQNAWHQIQILKKITSLSTFNGKSILNIPFLEWVKELITF
jgi:hypothetical protein